MAAKKFKVAGVSDIFVDELNGATFNGGVITAPVALTDAASVVLDASLGNCFTLTIGGNRTLANFTNRSNGQSICIRVTQDGTGSRTLAYGSLFRFAGGSQPTLSTGAGDIDILTFLVLDNVIYFISIIQDLTA